MIIGLNLDATEEFVSEFDPDKGKEPPEGNPTKFKLITLDSRVMGHLRDRATRMSVNPNAGADESVDTEIAMNEVAFETVQFGLGGIEPFADDKGAEIPFKTMSRRLRGKSYTIASDVVVNRLPMKVIAEISDRLRKMNNLGDDEGNV
jgi:hypothetical protein